MLNATKKSWKVKIYKLFFIVKEVTLSISISFNKIITRNILKQKGTVYGEIEHCANNSRVVGSCS